MTSSRPLDEVDDAAWAPRDVATLLFIVRGDEVLLIRKKRGLGAGKINGPGGRLEPGEDARTAARRELLEEVGVRPRSEPTYHGELRFQFVDGYSMRVHVFRADDCVGEPTETDEAVPLWASSSALPFDAMWADDRLWLPSVLSRGRVDGSFLFDGDVMIDHRLTLESPTGAPLSPS